MKESFAVTGDGDTYRLHTLETEEPIVVIKSGMTDPIQRWRPVTFGREVMAADDNGEYVLAADAAAHEAAAVAEADYLGFTRGRMMKLAEADDIRSDERARSNAKADEWYAKGRQHSIEVIRADLRRELLLTPRIAAVIDAEKEGR